MPRLHETNMESAKTTLQFHRYMLYLILAVPIIITCYQLGTIRTNNEIVFHTNGEYLIKTPQCTILDLDPWNPDARHFYKNESYTSCTSHPLLTSVHMNENNTVAILVVDKKLVPKYAKDGVSCCVSSVNRGSGVEIDNKITYTKCRTISNNSIEIDNDRPSMVTCRSLKKKKEVYKNVHVPIAITPTILNKTLNFKSFARPLSVLWVGIDSVSRLNMIRTMPKTRAFLLNDPSWLEYKVFNKIGDNTFPNLMAMLTGLDNTQAYSRCNPKTPGGLDKCDFIWHRFSAHNYVTAYAEDSYVMATFNYGKKGFTTPPVDYYMRSYQLACGDLKARTVDNSPYCTGPEVDGERIWRAAKEFTRVHGNHSYFGFFWMNTYSHQQLNTPGRMDAKVQAYMNDLMKLADNNTVIIFHSDHGIRFGKIRNTLTGYIEERMPFLFMKFPAWFQEQFPEEYNNLKLNQDRLITPYDMYMTLQDILQYSGFDDDITQSEGCQNCHSLFAPIDLNRSCADVAIAEHWCTCFNYRKEDGATKLAHKAARLLIEKIENITAEKNATSKCAKFKLVKILNTYRSQCFEDGADCDQNFLIVVIETKPTATFEATMSLKYNGKKLKGAVLDDIEDNVEMKMYSGISRLDAYAQTAKCTDDTYLKLMCHCK